MVGPRYSTPLSSERFWYSPRLPSHQVSLSPSLSLSLSLSLFSFLFAHIRLHQRACIDIRPTYTLFVLPPVRLVPDVLPIFTQICSKQENASRIRGRRRDRTPGRKEYEEGTRTFTLLPQSGRHVIFVHALLLFAPYTLDTGGGGEREREGRGGRTNGRDLNEKTRGDERKCRGKRETRGEKERNKKNDYVIASLYVTRAPRRHFSTVDVVVRTSQTKRVTWVYRKRVFRYPIKHLLVLVPRRRGEQVMRENVCDN